MLTATIRVWENTDGVPKFPRNSPEIYRRAGDLLLICALCRTNFAERRGGPLATRRRLASMPCSMRSARSHKRVCVYQVLRVNAFGERGVDRFENRARLGLRAVGLPEPCEARGGT